MFFYIIKVACVYGILLAVSWNYEYSTVSRMSRSLFETDLSCTSTVWLLFSQRVQLDCTTLNVQITAILFLNITT